MRRTAKDIAPAILLSICLLSGTAATGLAAERFTGPWDMATLKQSPEAAWGETSGGVQEVYYQGEPRDGEPTRVFAYFGCPQDRTDRVPGMVLVHGGGGQAFRQWVELWMQRGYAAIAMDLGGCGPEKQSLSDGMPPQGHPDKFRPFQTAEEARRLWTYHAVAAVVRAHSLLRSREEVDPARTGLTGISWGGYLTCIVAGLDDRFQVAVPVYGCGFLDANSVWLPVFDKLGPEQTKRWVDLYDPSRYLPGVGCRILFVNGTNDFAYPLDSYQKSYRAVPVPVDLRIEERMKHSHVHGWAPQEIGIYVDSVLTGGKPLPKLDRLKISDGRAHVEYTAEVPVVSSAIHFTTDTGPWKERKWQSAEAVVSGNSISAVLPEKRPLVVYLSATDRRGAMVTTEHAELP